MYELTGELLQDVSFSARGQVRLTFEFNEKLEALNMFNELNNAGKLSIKVGKHRARRSLDANAFCWVMIDKLSQKLNISKEEIYKQYIKEIGGNSTVVCVRSEAAESLCNGWKKNGLGWQTDTFDSKLDGCTNVILYYGSSTYDTAQMARLIDFVMNDCKQMGIETRPKEEIDSLLNSWR